MASLGKPEDRTPHPTQMKLPVPAIPQAVGGRRRPPGGDAFAGSLGEPRQRQARRKRMLVTEKGFGFLIAAIAAQLIFDGWPLPT